MQQKNGFLRGSYKVNMGKLLKCAIRIDENRIIKDIKISGDFFMHPEEKIDTLENILKDIHVDEIEEKIKKFFDKDVTLIGASPEDLTKLIIDTITLK